MNISMSSKQYLHPHATVPPTLDTGLGPAAASPGSLDIVESYPLNIM